MFQTFDTTSDPAQAAPRLKALREQMEALELSGFLVPRADEHQGEYVAASSGAPVMGSPALPARQARH